MQWYETALAIQGHEYSQNPPFPSVLATPALQQKLPFIIPKCASAYASIQVNEGSTLAGKVIGLFICSS
jgi:hypothetical protein